MDYKNEYPERSGWGCLWVVLALAGLVLAIINLFK